MSGNIDVPESINSNATVCLEDLDFVAELEQFLKPTETVVKDHGRLTPINPRTKKAFHGVASALYQRPRWNANARKFMHIERRPNADIFTGHWRFNLAILPKIFEVSIAPFRGTLYCFGRPIGR